MSRITIPGNSNSLYDFVESYVVPIDKLSEKEKFNKVKVFINGSWLGIVNNPVELYQSLKQKKYKGIINIYTSIIFDIRRREIRVCNDSGRLVRPLLRVKNNKLIITKDIIVKLQKKELSWEDLFTDCLIDESVLEYVDAAEQKMNNLSINILIVKFIQALFLEFWHLVFLFQSIINRRVIHINALWENRQWECM